MSSKITNIATDNESYQQEAGYIFILSDPEQDNYFKISYSSHLGDINDVVDKYNLNVSGNYQLQYSRVCSQSQHTEALIQRRLSKYLINNSHGDLYYFENIDIGVDNVNHIVDTANYLFEFSHPDSEFDDFITDNDSDDEVKTISRKAPLFFHTLDKRIEIAFDYILNQTSPIDPEYGVQTLLKFILTVEKGSPYAAKAAEAAYKLADVFESSEIVPRNKEDVLFCYKKSGELGHKGSIRKLMNIYYNGAERFDIEQNYLQAIKYLSMLSGDYSERVILAYIYCNGRQFLLKQNIQTGLNLCNYDPSHGNFWDLDIIKAKVLMAAPMAELGAERELSWDIEEDVSIIEKYANKHPYQILSKINENYTEESTVECKGFIEVKYILALYLLGDLNGVYCYKYESSNQYALRKIPVDVDIAITFLTLAAKEGHPLACSKLAELLEEGIVVAENEKETKRFRDRAKDCQYNIDSSIPFPVFGLTLF
jgi:TPR repeat protein